MGGVVARGAAVDQRLGSRRPYGAARILMMRIPRTASAAADLSWAIFLSSLREDAVWLDGLKLRIGRPQNLMRHSTRDGTP